MANVLRVFVSLQKMKQGFFDSVNHDNAYVLSFENGKRHFVVLFFQARLQVKTELRMGLCSKEDVIATENLSV